MKSPAGGHNIKYVVRLAAPLGSLHSSYVVQRMGIFVSSISANPAKARDSAAGEGASCCVANDGQFNVLSSLNKSGTHSPTL